MHLSCLGSLHTDCLPVAQVNMNRGMSQINDTKLCLAFFVLITH
ncbi:Uncharacterised protein [Acinetobacter baumannii]|nr:Uncharacterised protein [Acinetobacter baumannii]